MKNGKVAQQEEIKIIYGAKPLEDFFKRSYVSIVSIRENYELPVKKRNGFPSLEMGEFRAWCKEYGVDAEHPEKITVDALMVVRTNERIKAIPDRPLTGLDEIVRFTARPPDIIQAWVKNFPDCPIAKPVGIDGWRKATVTTQAILQWMLKNEIPIQPAACARVAAPFRY